MTEIIWQDPPGELRGLPSGADAEFAAQLRAHPGKWAIWRTEIGSSEATGVKQGRRAAFRPAGAYEARSTANGTGNQGKSTIYVRYVGEPEATS